MFVWLWIHFNAPLVLFLLLCSLAFVLLCFGVSEFFWPCSLSTTLGGATAMKCAVHINGPSHVSLRIRCHRFKQPFLNTAETGGDLSASDELVSHTAQCYCCNRKYTLFPYFTHANIYCNYGVSTMGGAPRCWGLFLPFCVASQTCYILSGLQPVCISAKSV